MEDFIKDDPVRLSSPLGNCAALKHIAETTQNTSYSYYCVFQIRQNGSVQPEQLLEQGVPGVAGWGGR